MAENRRELTEALDELERLNPRDEGPARVGEALSAYEAAVDEELQLIEADQLEQADIVDEERVDPGFEALHEVLEDTSAQYGDDARRADLIVDVATYGTALLAAITLIMMVRLWQREQSRRSEQKALRQSENRFRSLVQNASDIVVITGADGTLRYISPAVEQILGYKPEDIVGTDSFVPVHPDNAERVQNIFAEVASKPGVTLKFELRLQHADGSWRHIESNCTNLLHDPAVSGLVVNSRDVTERKRAEEKLRASEAELRALFEAMNDLILVFDGEGRCLKIAPTTPSNLYRPPEEMLGKTFHEVFPKEQADTFLERVQRTLETRSTNTFEFNLQLDDRLGWFEATFYPMLENTVVAVARDISERKENEEALRESESRLAEAQKLARIGGWGWDIVTDDVVWSDEIYRILGLDPREFEVSSTAFLNRIHPDDREYVEDTLMAVYTNHEPFSYEARILRPDGEMRIIHVRGEVAIDYAGTAVRMFGTTQDITDTRLAEEQIRFQAHLLGQVQAAVIATDLEGTVTYWNEHAERLYGWSREEALGRNIVQLMYGSTEAERVEEITQQIMERLRTSETSEGEVVVRHKDGSTLFAHVTNSLIHDTHGQVVGIVGVSTDISERKRAEKELHQSEERYRSVVDNVKEVIFQTDAEGLWTFLNPAWTEVTGFSVEESIGNSFLSYVHPEDRQRNLELFQPFIEREKDYCRHEIRYLTKEGGFRWTEVWARLTLDEDDVIVGTSGTLNDITERKRAEEELRRSESELAEAQRMAHVGNWSFDMTRDEGRWSDEMYRIFGFAPQEFPITYK